MKLSHRIIRETCIKGLPPEAFPDGHIGAVNPYRLAELIGGKRRWVLYSKSENQAFLAKTLGVKEYEKLFDTRGCRSIFSPVMLKSRMSLVIDPATAVDPSILTDPDISLSVPLDKNLPEKNISASATAIPHHVIKVPKPLLYPTGTGMGGTQGAPPGANAPKRWGIYKKSNGNDADFLIRLKRNEDDIISDAIQGAAQDCYFISALYSFAWCTSTFPSNMAGPNYTIRFNWVDDNRVCYYQNSTVSKELALDTNSVPAYASATPDNFEIWCGIYEKAYAKIKCPPSGLPSDCGATDNPDIGASGDGDPLYCLMWIGKYYKFDATPKIFGRPTVFEIPYSKANYTNPITDPTQQTVPSWNSFDELAARNSGAWNGNSTKTQFPTVASTYNPDLTPGAPVYNDSMIVAKHSYSVLGLFKNNGKNFIVLRNPWGPRPNCGDPTDPQIQNALADGDYAPTGYTATPPSPIPLKPRTTPTGQVVGNEGIFGLEYSVFETYFEKFGWVQPVRCTSTIPQPFP